MASKPKLEKINPYEPLITIQAGMEALMAQGVMHAVGIKNTIKRQPLCIEGVETLEQLDKVANGLKALVNAYRKELCALADEGRSHAA